MLGNDRVHGRHPRIVEHAVEQPNLASGFAVRRDEVWRDMLDDDARFHDRLAVVDQQRKLADRPMGSELGLDVRLFHVAELERRAAFVKGDQGFPGVRRKAVTEELQAHQLPSDMAFCRFSSFALASTGGLAPTATPSSGTKLAIAVPFDVIRPLSIRKVAGGVPTR